jgi:hypothetical protein
MKQHFDNKDDADAYTMYERLAVRQRNHFDREVNFDFEAFHMFLKGQGWPGRGATLRTGGARAIDRIDSFRDYTLDNMQLTNHSTNSSKGANVSIGSLKRTTTFFKVIRGERSQEEMAVILDMPLATYQRYEEKAYGCSIELLSILRRKLSLTWSELGRIIDECFDMETQK